MRITWLMLFMMAIREPGVCRIAVIRIYSLFGSSRNPTNFLSSADYVANSATKTQLLSTKIDSS